MDQGKTRESRCASSACVRGAAASKVVSPATRSAALRRRKRTLAPRVGKRTPVCHSSLLRNNTYLHVRGVPQHRTCGTHPRQGQNELRSLPPPPPPPPSPPPSSSSSSSSCRCCCRRRHRRRRRCRRRRCCCRRYRRPPPLGCSSSFCSVKLLLIHESCVRVCACGCVCLCVCMWKGASREGGVCGYLLGTGGARERSLSTLQSAAVFPPRPGRPETSPLSALAAACLPSG